MTASLFMIVALSLLAVVSGLCFVGCVLDTSGLPGNTPPDKVFTQYSGEDVIKNMTCVAYWRLDEPASVAENPVPQAKAKDAKGNNDGNYTHKGNAPVGMFPCPAFQIIPGLDSAGAIGFLSLGTESLLPGDAVQPGNDPAVLTTGMQIDGGFVTVPVSGTINPTPKFSIELWARPEWKNTDPPAARVVIDSRNDVNDATFSGYAIVVDEAGNWEAQIGAVGVPAFVIATGTTANLNQRNHVVLTFDGTTILLFVDGQQAVSKALGGTFAPNTQAPLVIGVGAPWLPTRMPGSPNGTFPILPFKGTIQDVAVYNDVLSAADVQKHFDDGSGNTKVPAG